MPVVRASIRVATELHARPAARLVGTARRFGCAITLVGPGGAVDSKDMMELITANLESGQVIEIVADGADAEEAVRAVSDELARASFGW